MRKVTANPGRGHTRASFLVGLTFLGGLTLLASNAAPVLAEPTSVSGDLVIKGSIGVALADMPDGARGAKIARVYRGSPAHAAGLSAGDIIVQRNNTEIKNAWDLTVSMSNAATGETVMLRYRRGDQEKVVALTLVDPNWMVGAREAVDTGGHLDAIRGVAITPDGKHLISAGEDRLVRFWDIATGVATRTLILPFTTVSEGKVYAMALSPDGRWLALGGWTSASAQDYYLHWYDAETGKLDSAYPAHKHAIEAIAFSADGKRAISAGLDMTAVIWDTDKRTPLRTLSGHSGPIYAVGLSPDGTRAYTAGADGVLRLWDTTDGKIITDMTGHNAKVGAIAVAPDGSVATGDLDGEIRLWNGRDGRPQKTLARHGAAVAVLKFSPDGRKLLSTCGEVPPCVNHVWDVNSGKSVVTRKSTESAVLAAAFSPDGRHVATGGFSSREVHLWDAAKGVTRKVFKGNEMRLALAAPTPHNAKGKAAQRVIIDPRQLLASGVLKRQIALPANAPAGNSDFRPLTNYGALTLATTQGGEFDENIVLTILQERATVGSIRRDGVSGYRHLAYSFSANGDSVLSGATYGILGTYDLKGNQRQVLRGHSGNILGVAPSQDGRFIISTANDQTARLWNAATGELVVSMAATIDGRWAMWTPRGYYAASPGGDALFGYELSYGPVATPRFLPVSRLKAQLNRPDVVALAIEKASSAEAVMQLGAANTDLFVLLENAADEPDR